jgi:ATP-binding cassette subfamily C (CFTR/MRP) protein 3
VLTIILIQQERKKGWQSSGVLFIFWLMEASVFACGLSAEIVNAYYLVNSFKCCFKLFTTILSQGAIDDKFRLGFYVVFFLLTLTQLILSCIVDRKSPHAPESQEVSSTVVDSRFQYCYQYLQKPCPEAESAFVSRLTFWWFTR